MGVPIGAPMRAAKRLLLVALLATALLANRPVPLAALDTSATIISNGADLPTAEEFRDFLLQRGISSVIANATDFDGHLAAGERQIFIIGGPNAYDGVGELSSGYLTDEERDRLVEWRGYRNFYIRSNGTIEIILMAGHTREETREALSLFMEEGFTLRLFELGTTKTKDPFLSRGGGTLKRGFSWIYGGKEFSITMSFPKALIDHYKNKDHTIPAEEWYILASDPFDNPYMGSLTQRLENMAWEAGYSGSERVDFVIAFVQSLPYTQDWVTSPYDEYPRYPLETLADGGGDCEDTSILLATLLMEMGYDSVLIILPGHMAVGVALENAYGYYFLENVTRYYYVETTGRGWRVGVMPTVFLDLQSHQYKLLHPIPVKIGIPVVVSFEAITTQHELGGSITVTAVIENVGDDDVEITAVAGVQGGGVILIYTEEGNLTIPAGSTAVVSFTLTKPKYVKTWAVIRLMSGYRKLDEATSTYEY